MKRDRVLKVRTTRDTPRRWQCYTPPPKSQDECYRGVWNGVRQGFLEGTFWGCSCDTPATHSKLRKETGWGSSYALEREGGGGCSVCLRHLGNASIEVRRAALAATIELACVLAEPCGGASDMAVNAASCAAEVWIQNISKYTLAQESLRPSFALILCLFLMLFIKTLQTYP